MQELYFTTTDTALALALRLAGGELVDIWNVYTPEQLQKLGCTAREAWQRGIPGKVTYYFEPTEELKANVAAWWEERTKLTTGDTGTTMPHVNPVDVIRIAAAVLIQRKPFVDLWRKVTPKITVRESGEPRRINDEDGVGYRLELPGLKTVSINAPAAVKEKLRS